MKKILATAVFFTILLSCSMNVNAAGLKDIFSAQYYADSYEDLYAAFEYDEAKLYKHVKEYGIKEGRNISPILDVVYYRETYPDLNAAFGDNWDLYVNHYFEYGIKEGRDNGTDFDVIRYVNSYADLRQAFDEDYEALAKHYIEYGIKENRTMALKPQLASTSQTASAAPAPTYYEETIYDEDGRISKIEVYSDSSKTTLVSWLEYVYLEGESHYYVYTRDAQGTYLKGEEYNDGILTARILVDKYDKETNVAISYTYYEFYNTGIVMREMKVIDEVIVKEIEYHEDGSVFTCVEYDSETGEEISYIGYYENGVLGYQWGYDANGMEFEKEWDQNGTLRYHYGHDENGFFEKEWDENGNLITEGRGE